MATETEFDRNFIAVEKSIEFLAAKPVVNVGYVFTDIDGNPYNFTGQTGLFFKIWEDGQDGRLLLDLNENNGLSIGGSTIVMNTTSSQMDIAPTTPTKYYYEMGYINSGGYEIVLMFTEANFIGRP